MTYENKYHEVDKRMSKIEAELLVLYDEANAIYRQWLWNGILTDAQETRLAELRSQYIIKSGGSTMPPLEYVPLH